MSRLQSYIFRQLVGPFAVFLFSLTAVVWLTQSLRFVDWIVNKGLPVRVFLQMAANILPGILTIVLPIALFVGVIYSYHRLLAESEIVIMRNAGLSNREIAMPALYLAAGATLATFALTLYFLPVGARAFKDMKVELRTNLSYIPLQEGAFNTVTGNLTIYIRERRGSGELLGILVHDSRDPDKPVTMMAERGALIKTDSGSRFVLVNGNRQELDRESGLVSMLHFDRYALDLSQFIKTPKARWLKENERFLHELIWIDENNPADLANAKKLRAAAHDRITSPFFAIAFALLALAAVLGHRRSRRGMAMRLVAAVAILVLIRTAGFGFVNLAARSEFAIPLIYLNVTIAMVAAIHSLSEREPIWSRLLNRVRGIG